MIERFPRMARIAPPWLLLLSTLLLGGCAMVTVKPVASADYMAVKRGDVLTTQRLSNAAQEALSVIGLDAGQCRKDLPHCLQALSDTDGLGQEQQLATLAELWTQTALGLTPKDKDRERLPLSEAALDAWLEAARYAYAYLFFSGRTPAERAFEERQTQVRDYYNYAADQAAAAVFQRSRQRALQGEDLEQPVRNGNWTLAVDFGQLRLNSIPRRLVSASAIGFAGMRSTYRRDGFGAELVVEMEPPSLAVPVDAEGGADKAPVFSEMPSIAATALLRFSGDTLQEVLDTREVVIEAYEPERTASVDLHGQRVPLAANFTAAYGLWLAQSGFATQSLRTLFGRGEGIREPHIYLMQPYDPDRRIIFMLHGLASSPEAWVNVANEVMGDPVLREHFQVWQVYYPTNAPVALNRYEIDNALDATLRHFDPGGRAPASRDMVLIGHSMGGVLARLLVTSSGEQLWDGLLQRYQLSGERLQRVRAKLGPLLHFEARPTVERAIFIAAPHRGTDAAGNRLGRMIGKLVRLPVTILGKFGDVFEMLVDPAGAQEEKAEKPRIPNSIDNLKSSDPFVRASSQLPIMPGLKYHSIIAQRKPEVPLADSDDGLVPYWSAHLDGALSEKVIVSGHSVQETPQAILEIRRILHLDLAEREGAR